LKNLLNEGDLNTDGVGEFEETLVLAMLANPGVLKGGMDAGVGVVVRYTLLPMKVFSNNVD